MPEGEGRDLMTKDVGDDLSLEEQIDRINWILMWKAKMEEWKRKYGDKNPNVTASTGGPEYGTRNYTPDPTAPGEIPWTPMPEETIPWTPMPEGDATMGFWDKIIPDWASDLWGDTPPWLQDMLKNLGKNFLGGKAGELLGPDLGPAERAQQEFMDALTRLIGGAEGAVDNLAAHYDGATFRGPDPEMMRTVFGAGQINADDAGTRFTRAIPYEQVADALAGLAGDRDWQWEGELDALRELVNARSGLAGAVGGLSAQGANMSMQWLQELMGLQGDIAKQFTGGNDIDSLARQIAMEIATQQRK